MEEVYILVVGGAGYLGSFIVLELLEQNYNVVVFDNLVTGLKDNIPHIVEFVHGDLEDYDKVLSTFKKYKIGAVINVASLTGFEHTTNYPFQYYSNNLQGLNNLLEVMRLREVKKLIFFSSHLVYDQSSVSPISEDSLLNPSTVYGDTKLASENMIRHTAKVNDFKYIILRLFHVAGASSSHFLGIKSRNIRSFISLVALAMLGLRKLDIFGVDYQTADGTKERDYVHVIDVARAVTKSLKYLDTNDKSEIINIGSGKSYSIRDIIDTANNMIEYDINIEEKPKSEDDVAVRFADISKAKELLDFKATLSLSEIINSEYLFRKESVGNRRMRVLLYFDNYVKKSGIGRALSHQKKALTLAGIEYTEDENDVFDIAHINTLSGRSLAIINRLKRHNIPVIVHGHSTIEDFKNSFRLWRLVSIWYNRQLYSTYKKADLIITPTEYSKGLIDSYRLGVKTIALTNGIDITEYYRNQEYIDEFKSKYEIGNDEPYIVGIGLPFVRKGLLDFFEIAKSFPGIRFVWFGGINKLLISDEINKAIKAKPNNVIMAGFVDSRIIKGALADSKMLLFPSFEETEGIVVLEALAMKTVCLVRDIGVYYGWLNDSVNCYKARNNAEFISKIKHIIDSDNTKIIEAGYQTVLERNITIVGDKLKNIYQEELSMKKSDDDILDKHFNKKL